MRVAPTKTDEGRATGPALSVKAARRAKHLRTLAGLALSAPSSGFAFWIPLAAFSVSPSPAERHRGRPLASSAKLDFGRRTLWIAAQVTVISGVLADVYVGALLAASQAGWRHFASLRVVPFLTSIVVRTYAWIIVLGPSGPVNTIAPRRVRAASRHRPRLQPRRRADRNGARAVAAVRPAALCGCGANTLKISTARRAPWGRTALPHGSRSTSGWACQARPRERRLCSSRRSASS